MTRLTTKGRGDLDRYELVNKIARELRYVSMALVRRDPLRESTWNLENLKNIERLVELIQDNDRDAYTASPFNCLCVVLQLSIARLGVEASPHRRINQPLLRPAAADDLDDRGALRLRYLAEQLFPLRDEDRVRFVADDGKPYTAIVADLRDQAGMLRETRHDNFTLSIRHRLATEIIDMLALGDRTLGDSRSNTVARGRAAGGETVWFERFREAVPAMLNEIQARLASNGAVTARWLAVTHEAGWPVMQEALLSVRDGRVLRTGASLRVTIAVLDPDGSACSAPGGPDPELIRATMRRVAKFRDQNVEQLAMSGSSVECVTYDIVPTWHALLIDAEVAFYSPCIAGGASIAGPQGGVEVLRRGVSPAQDDRIMRIGEWIDYFTGV